MTHNSTRKQFFAKLLGVTAAAGLCANVRAKSTAAPQAPGRTAIKKHFEVRADSRSIARRSDSV